MKTKMSIKSHKDLEHFWAASVAFMANANLVFIHLQRYDILGTI